MILHVLIAMIAGWIQRHQQQVIAYLQEENRILKAQLGGRRLRLTDTERRVVYLRAADNVLRLLPIWLRGVNQPVIRSRNPFSRPHPARLA
jgi:hypothetical protein